MSERYKFLKEELDDPLPQVPSQVPSPVPSQVPSFSIPSSSSPPTPPLSLPADISRQVSSNVLLEDGEATETTNVHKTVLFNSNAMVITPDHPCVEDVIGGTNAMAEVVPNATIEEGGSSTVVVVDKEKVRKGLAAVRHLFAKMEDDERDPSIYASYRVLGLAAYYIHCICQAIPAEIARQEAVGTVLCCMAYMCVVWCVGYI